MYSEKVEDLLEDKGINNTDRIRIILSNGSTVKGELMPRTGQGNPDCIVVKRESGYNTSHDIDNIKDLELVEKNENDENSKGNVERERDGSLPDVMVLHTGGTIASRVSYEEGGVKPAFEADDLLEMYPEISEKANIDSEVVAQMLSEDMEPEHWQEIARKVFEVKDDFDGIIIGHGTDTMQYTASALSFMLRDIDVPVVLVGAQRSSDRPSTDAAVNLRSAVDFIAESIPGVFVAMHGGSGDEEVHVHRGTRVRKMHTSRRDAFRTISDTPFAKVDTDTGKVKVLSDYEIPEKDPELVESIEKRVGLVKVVPGMSLKMFKIYEDIEGLVVEGTGLGHMPVNSFDEHTEHHEKILEKVSDIADDALVCMSSQCIFGRVNMNVYDAGVKIQEAGVVSSGSMLPGTAYVKLMWSLGSSEDLEEARRLFVRNVAGEFVEREDADGF